MNFYKVTFDDDRVFAFKTENNEENNERIKERIVITVGEEFGYMPDNILSIETITEEEFEGIESIG